MSAQDPTMSVEYRPITGFPGYRVGSNGSVWSLRRCKATPRHARTGWRKLVPRTKKNGYLHVKLARDGRDVSVHIHTLVLETFVGPRPPGLQCCHNDNNKLNNNVTNLRWDTPKGNASDRFYPGGSCLFGSRNPASKLKEDQIAEICYLRSQGFYYRDIAARFNVSYSTIRSAVLGLTYAHAQRN